MEAAAESSIRSCTTHLFESVLSSFSLSLVGACGRLEDGAHLIEVHGCRPPSPAPARSLRERWRCSMVQSWLRQFAVCCSGMDVMHTQRCCFTIAPLYMLGSC